jgi:transposase
MHREAVTAAGAALVRFAQSCGLIRDEWVAIDGTKFRAVASADSVRERAALERYLDSCERADEEARAEFDPSRRCRPHFGSSGSIRSQRRASCR